MAPLIHEQILSERDVAEFIRRKIASSYTPGSVYRLQMNKDMTFRRAAEIVPYLKELGAGAVFCSPYFKATPGSAHGYDLCDPHRLNPEIGSDEDFEHFCKTLQEHGMGQILDVVPNHMGILGKHNRLWLDVLENGQHSIYARFFDINWDPLKAELKGKVLLPILGDYYGRVLESQELKLSFSEGSIQAHYFDHFLPIDPKSYPLILTLDLIAMQERLGDNHPAIVGLMEVLNSFLNLHTVGERTPERLRQRHEEKEAAKKHLGELANKYDEVREHIERAIAKFEGRKGIPASFDPLDELLNHQNYRLAYWRVASEVINYRRFFDINSLGAIRMEEPAVFDFAHQLVFRLIDEGKLDGLRIDHPDGLYDPAKYLKKLQMEFLCRGLMKEHPGTSHHDALALVRNTWRFVSSGHHPPLYVVVEKILDRKEALPQNWRVHGTVGYDFLNALNGIFIQSKNEEAFSQFYESFIEHPIDWEELVYQKKYFYARAHMASEINTLGHKLNRISEQNRMYRDLTLNHLTEAVAKTIACLPVYRTYTTLVSAKVSKRDEKYIRIAIEKAKSRSKTLDPTIFDFLQSILLLKLEEEFLPAVRRQIRDFILRFQQLTSVIMAKGVEDTVFYINNHFISLNEVGGDPAHFGVSLREFHQQNIDRIHAWPKSFLASSTHDNKRSQDARMRLNVISEIPQDWKRLVSSWAAINKDYRTLLKGKPEPTRNQEYFIYQTLASVWPNEPMDEEAYKYFTERCWSYFLKAVREAKIYTSWTSPDAEYEAAVEKFVRSILRRGERNPFLESFLPFQEKLSRCGMFNSLSALALATASPGVADNYQGSEIWDYSLVDPDNRRPVDYPARRRLLEYIQDELKSNSAFDCVRRWMEKPQDGKIKMYWLWKSMRTREENKEIFIEGDYVPLEIEGEHAERAVSWMRVKEGRRAIVAAGRFFADRVMAGLEPTGADAWGETAVRIPLDACSEPLHEIYTGREITASRDGTFVLLRLSEIFSALPAALLMQHPRN